MKSRSMVCGVLIVLLMCAALPPLCPITAAEEVGQISSQSFKVDPQFDWRSDYSGPLCGIYAICRIAELEGIEARPSDFMESRFLGKCQGSTAAELDAALRRLGGRPRVLGKVSWVDLFATGLPAIVNVRPDITSTGFTHWVVVAPVGDGFKLFDGNQPGIDVTAAELMAIWNGVTVFPGFDGSEPIVAVYSCRVALVSGALIALFFLYVVFSRFRGESKTQLTGGGAISAIFVMSIVACMVFGLVLADLRNFSAGYWASTAHLRSPSVNLVDLETLRHVEPTTTLLIDARLTRDFKSGTLPGAVNIPVSASLKSIGEFLRNVPRSTPVVVFCQSKLCTFDDVIAEKLLALHFQNVRSSELGWREIQSSSHAE